MDAGGNVGGSESANDSGNSSSSSSESNSSSNKTGSGDGGGCDKGNCDFKQYFRKAREKIDEMNWYLGTSAAVLETSSSSFRITNGAYNGNSFSFKRYPSGWKGGSIARITTYNIRSIGGFLGRASFVTGLSMDIIGVANGSVSIEKAGFNTTMGLYGLKFNPVAGSLYFFVDAFYPGGWTGDETNKGALSTYGDTVTEYQKRGLKFRDTGGFRP